jgi:hypothetical protein
MPAVLISLDASPFARSESGGRAARAVYACRDSHRARVAALRPARRPNTSASVMALPESRLAADRFAGGEQARQFGLHVGVGHEAAHMVVGDRRHLDRHSGQIDMVPGQAVDDRPEGAP